MSNNNHEIISNDSCETSYEDNNSNHSAIKTPIVIGCIGGSGSRLISQVLLEKNYYLGSCKNKAEDNLWYSLLFRRLPILNFSQEKIIDLLDVFVSKMTNNSTLTSEQIIHIKKIANSPHSLPHNILNKSVNSLLDQQMDFPHSGKWGWKEPNSHLLLPELNQYIPQLKYIFIVRHALDMAFSKNQQQLTLWGKHFLGNECEVSPYYSLKYWLLMYFKIKKQKQIMGDRLLILNYDNLVKSHYKTVTKLLHFIGSEVNDKSITAFTKLIKPQKSIGRYKKHSLDVFDKKDIELLNKEKLFNEIIFQ